MRDERRREKTKRERERERGERRDESEKRGESRGRQGRGEAASDRTDTFLLARRVGTISILQGEYWAGQSLAAKHWTRPWSNDTTTNSIFSLARSGGRRPAGGAATRASCSFVRPSWPVTKLQERGRRGCSPGGRRGGPGRLVPRLAGVPRITTARYIAVFMWGVSSVLPAQATFAELSAALRPAVHFRNRGPAPHYWMTKLSHGQDRVLTLQRYSTYHQKLKRC